MAARVKSQAGDADDRAAPSIPPAFRNDLTLGATEAIMWIACRRRFSHDTIREHLERRTRNLRRFTGSEDDPRLQVSPALSNRVDKAQILLFHLIIGGVPAIGTLDDEGDPDHEKRIPVPVEFLKDGAYIDLLSGHLRADPLLEKHWGHQRPAYLDVDIDRDAFFKALAGVEPKERRDTQAAEAASTPADQHEHVESHVDPAEETGRACYERWADDIQQLRQNGTVKTFKAAAMVVAGQEKVDVTYVLREERRIRKEREEKREK